MTNSFIMAVTDHDTDKTQSRLIIRVNGHEIDIIADVDGVGVDIKKLPDGQSVASCGVDWP